MPERVSAEDAKAILADFAGMFDENDTPDGFFDKMKQIASAHGYAADTKAYKADPSAFKGAVGDVSMVVRVAVAGRQNAPDLQTVMGILGERKGARPTRKVLCGALMHGGNISYDGKCK